VGTATSGTVTGDLTTLANTVVLLLLVVFLSTNTAVLVLRRDRVEAEHFQVPAVIPVLAIASCFLLLSQQEARTWLYAGVLLAIGVVLHLVAQATRRRESRSAAEQTTPETVA